MANGREIHVLMAADARNDLTRHGSEPRAHELKCGSVFVQRLNGDRSIRRDRKVCGAVLFDRDGSQNGADVPRSIQPHAVDLPSHAMVRKIVGEDPQFFDFPLPDPFQTRSGVEVSQKDRRRFAFRVGPVGDRGRDRRFLKRDRLQDRAPRLLIKKHEIVENIHEVNSPFRRR